MDLTYLCKNRSFSQIMKNIKDGEIVLPSWVSLVCDVSVVFLENLVGIYKRLRAKGEYHMLEAMTYKEVDGLLYPELTMPDETEGI